MYFYAEEVPIAGGDSVEVVMAFTTQPWGEGTFRAVDVVVVNGDTLEALTDGLYDHKVSWSQGMSLTLTFQYGSVESTLTIPVDTLTPPQFVSPTPDTVQPGDTAHFRLTRPAYVEVQGDTGVVWRSAGMVDSGSVVFPDPGNFLVMAFVWDTLLDQEASWGGVAVRAGGSASFRVQVGAGGAYALTADTLSSGCSAAAPCFSWTPSDSIDDFSVWRVTPQGEEIWWRILGAKNPQDTTQRVPFAPSVVYGRPDPLRYEVIIGPVDTLRSGETYRVYGGVGGRDVWLGDYTRE